MSKYTFRKYNSLTPSYFQQRFETYSQRKEPEHYLDITESESEEDITNVIDQKMDLTCFLNTRKFNESRFDSGDTCLVSEESLYPWIDEGFNELQSLEIDNCSRCGGDDRFLRVLNAIAPNAQETSKLLDQVVELRDELTGRIKDLTGFKEEIRKLGKLLKAEPSKLRQGRSQAQPDPASL